MTLLFVLLFGVAACLTPMQQGTPYGLPEGILNEILQHGGKPDDSLVDPSAEPEYLDYSSNSYIPNFGSKYFGQTINVDDKDDLFDLLDVAPFGAEEKSDSFLLNRQAQPRLRDTELLQHSSLWGSQLVAGGAGEGNQRLSPDGSFVNKANSKSDSALPAYCEPPNPCPFDYTAADGCLEDFENTAAFSRSYQQQQQCICDSEHMFACALSTEESAISALARKLTHTDSWNDEINHVLGMPTLDVVDEKYNFFQKKGMETTSGYPSKLTAMSIGVSAVANHGTEKENPFLAGEKHSVAAKKG